jgi:hypothetical protein
MAILAKHRLGFADVLDAGVADERAQRWALNGAKAIGKPPDVIERAEVEDLGLRRDAGGSRLGALSVASGYDDVPAALPGELAGGAKPEAARPAGYQDGALGARHVWNIAEMATLAGRTGVGREPARVT